ncbi:TnsD family Tn7-like transposition protein [Bacillus paranthracis]
MYLKYITKESILLANNNYNFENVNQIYRTILTQKGYINKNDLLDRKKLLKDFLEFYGEELLILMNSTITDSANCWLIKLIRTHYTSFHPIRHILLTIFFR